MDVLDQDILLNKTATIKRCLQRISVEFAADPANLKNYTKQDSIILNLQRACEASLDLAMHVIAQKKLGVPQKSRDAFALLVQQNVLDVELGKRMQAMVGFRNIAVHDYQALNLEILEQILQGHLGDFIEFIQEMHAFAQGEDDANE